MKILFLENRYFTQILDALAKRLLDLGHEIHWVVQNPAFSPSNGVIHTLSFPSKQSYGLLHPILRNRLFESDRGVRWFEGDGLHWQNYFEQIKQILDHIQPDVVFGEVTEFHELMTCDICKSNNIPFLSPNVTRYPVGRLNFFKYDSLITFGGDGTQLTPSEATTMLGDIVARKVQPTYMVKVKKNPVSKYSNALRDKVKILVGWLNGERYVTPSPWVKLKLGLSHFLQKRSWERTATNAIPTDLHGKTWVLYPLQMQPESNIEVWGSPWSDQTAIVKRVANALETIGVTLVVKPNPKSKYELTSALCDVVRNTKNIIALSHNTPMTMVFEKAPAILTVTGTVLLECIFSGKPVMVLGSHAMSTYPGVTSISEPEDIVAVLKEKKLLSATNTDAINLLRNLFSNSYPAMIWDQFSTPEMLNDENTNRLVAAFSDVLAKINDMKTDNNLNEFRS